MSSGLNKDTVQGLAKATGNKRFAYDSYRRLLDMLGGVVLDIPHEAFEAKLEDLKAKVGVLADVDLSAEHLEELCEMYAAVYEEYGKVFPYDPLDQIKACVKAVFGSWNSQRAIRYREINGITGLLGTACNIQTMVFGNLGENSGTGVAFSRDPGTGKNVLKGEYLINAQGEDVVAISTMQKNLPEAYMQFIENVNALEQ
jgi:pyruvate, orthophosphate dikinase